jgi:Xaa-Pro dipeptidase
MALHFTIGEFSERQRRVIKRMIIENLDGLLLFRQESMYYLTGYDTTGFTMFQAMYFGADGSIALLVRSPDIRQAAITSIVKDIRMWADRAGANPANELRDLLESYNCRGKRIGIEYHAYGLTAQRGKLIDAAMENFCELVDASDLVRIQRLVKSSAELEYVRESGRLADGALTVANRMAVEGEAVGAIYGKMVDFILKGGGDPTASWWPLGHGQEAMLVRYHTDLGKIANNDQITFEFGASYRHYHTALMNVALTGKVNPDQKDMFKACVEGLTACEDILRPGNTAGDIFETHLKVLTKAGYGKHTLRGCGYTMGAMFPPTWMDLPMFYAGNPQVLEAGMVFFIHMILLNSDNGLAMSLGETAIVKDGNCELVTHAPRELVVN